MSTTMGPPTAGHGQTAGIITRLRETDPQFLATFSDPAVVAAKQQPGLRMAQVMQIVMEGYADRPALGRRARALVTDPATGRTTAKLLPRFETISYAELWADARRIAADWHGHAKHPIRGGDFVCILGYTSTDYPKLLLANIHVGAVNVPLQTSASAQQHADIMAETAPRVLATGIDYIDNAIDAVLLGAAPQRLVVLDLEAGDDDHREALEAARRRLKEANCPILVETIGEIITRGAGLAPAPLYIPAAGEDPLSWLFYTSGSTGTPKGAIFTQKLTINTWLSAIPMPVITLSFMPMSHLIGNGFMLMTLANGGTTYCTPKSDLSTLFEDLSLARPTMTSLVPRVCELFYHHYLSELDRRIASGADPEVAADEIKLDIRNNVLGGRLVSVGCGSASIAPEVYDFMESMLGVHMPIGYASTEIGGGTVLVDWKIQRPLVIDYKLEDVPELGYFSTDKPHPRGELLVKTAHKMGGYYKRPDLTAERYDDGDYYRTGDVMAEFGPDHLVFVDRRNNVIKLSQGEFVAISRLEALYAKSPAIHQIYLYGTSERSFLLGVIVPTDALRDAPADEVKAAIRRSLNQIAVEEHLNGYEVPRDFIIEPEAFGVGNGLLTGVGKHQRPRLKERYGPALETLYARIAQDQVEELRALRTAGADAPVIETVTRALQATLGVASKDAGPDHKFGDLGGDSLSALSLSLLLEEIFGIEVPVGVITNPAGSIRQLASFIEAERSGGGKRPSFAAIHGAKAITAQAKDLTLDRFFDARLLASAPSIPAPVSAIRNVLLTGATGFLGRFQMMSWLERLAKTGGRLTLVSRGEDSARAQTRIEHSLATDPALLAHFRELAAKHLEVLPGDLGLPGLGLDEATWSRLAGEIDLIVHTGAHVNHVLPYNQLFAANVTGTAELIRLALTTRLKYLDYVSTMGVSGLDAGLVDEDSDIRKKLPACAINESYSNGYAVSKWASEVLLREGHEQAGLPVRVYRPGMILAHSKYTGQLNVPDMFTRLLYSLAVTGVAPATFYGQDLSNGRPEGRYDGFSVGYLADVITAIGAEPHRGFHSYNLASPHEAAASLDSFVDWMIEAGCAIQRVERYDDWYAHIETAMRALPDEQRAQSMLLILEPYRRPQAAGTATHMPLARFQAAAEAAGQPIPRFDPALIHKYVADLKHLNLL
jgi:fatty acid CoA ligase FadD9